VTKSVPDVPAPAPEPVEKPKPSIVITIGDDNTMYFDVTDELNTWPTNKMKIAAMAMFDFVQHLRVTIDNREKMDALTKKYLNGSIKPS
jgi:hypothetical protein